MQSLLRPVVGLGFVVAVILLTLQTTRYTRVWASDCALFADTLRKSPNSSPAHNNHGVCLAEAGRYGAAEEHFREANRLDPANRRAGYNLALELHRRAEFAEAYSVLEPYIAQDSARPDFRFLVGVLGVETGAEPSAPAITADPVYLVGRGTALEIKGRAESAWQCYKRALEAGEFAAAYRRMAVGGAARLAAAAEDDSESGL